MSNERGIVVTKHALRRWLERVEGLDLEPFARKANDDGEVVAAACRAHGVDETWLRGVICEDVAPRVPVTARLRGSRVEVRGQRARYVVEKGRVVMTVYALGSGRPGKRWAESREEVWA